MPEPIPSATVPLKDQVASFPDAPGVYQFRNPSGGILYVGKAISLKKRVASYFHSAGQSSPKVRSLVSRTASIDYILTEDEKQAFLLESNLIKKHRPRYNVVLRDDKSYPYIRLTLFEDFPRVLMSRRPLADGSKYYGPYPNLKVREILKVIYRFFNIRDCDIDIDGKAERPCLSYQIKQCPAPCTGYVQKAEYARLVERVQWFLEGKHDELTDHVRAQMHRSAEKQEYEEAAKYRDLLGTLEQMQGGASMIVPEKKDLDVFAFAAGLSKILVSVVQVRQGRVTDHVRLTLENEMDQSLEESLGSFFRQYYSPGVHVPAEVLLSDRLELDDESLQWIAAVRKGPVQVKNKGDEWRRNLMAMAEKNVLTALKEDVAKTQILTDLQALLKLSTLPREIACFDISTLQGTYTVGSAVLFKDGVPEKSRYRKFKIKEVAGQDDFRSHQEMMVRYLRLLDREGLPPPDLFLIDGGKGQLSAVKTVMDRELPEGYGLASLAKREEEVFVPGSESAVDFSGHLKVRHLLQRVRDESHRFAVGYHRVLRDRGTVSSMLQKVKGIGPTRLRSLLNHFESAKEIQKASLEDLETVPGFSRELSRELYAFLHPSQSPDRSSDT